MTSESIIKWAIENESITTGYYNVTVNGTTYPIHLYVYNGDQTWDDTMEFGDAGDCGTASTNAQNMVAVIVRGDLTIGENGYVTAYKSTYGGPKGFYLHVTGILTNNGTISMTGKGAKHDGEDVYLWKNIDNTYEYVPSQGAQGGTGTASGGDKGVNGNPGTNGTDRKTGGGGGGANTYSSYNNGSTLGGNGGYGTSYSGGAGGGGGNHGWNTAANKYIGGSCYGVNGGNRCQTGVGVTTGSVAGSGVQQTNLGTGGLLIIFGAKIVNTEYAWIESEGISPATSVGDQGTAFTFGGASGGGSINIFSAAYENEGTVSALGGEGVQSQGSYSNRRSKSGNGGEGSVTYTQVVLDENLLHPKLSSMTVTPGTIQPSFDPDTRTYDLSLTSEQSKITITALPILGYEDDIKIIGDGVRYVKPGNDIITVTLTSKYGFVDTYQIRTTRAKSSYPYLDGIIVDGEAISSFNPTTLTYDVYLDEYQDEVDVDVVLARTEQTVTGLGKVKIPSGITTTSFKVTSEDGTRNATYTLRLHRDHTALLKKLEAVGFELEPEFSHSVYEYELKLPYNEMDIDFETETYDEEAKVVITGNKFMLTRNGDITVTVNEPNVAPKHYVIHYSKELASEVKISYDYPYDSKYPYYTFKAPYSGKFVVELWGAQGGGSGNSRGGYGGYTKGVLTLERDEEIYVYVGATTTTGTGGYNGGGNSVGALYGGGGATDIRLNNGTWSSFDSLKSRIMVAAGGGGYGMSYIGGYAGGLTGGEGIGDEPGHGATQTRGGYAVANAGGDTAGKFGQGGSGSWSSEPLGGGGSGYYGGSSGGGTNNNGSGGGGSSYISGHAGSNSISKTSTSLSTITHTGSPEHYSGYIFEDTVMIDGAGLEWVNGSKGTYVGQPDPDNPDTLRTGNIGNGFARITPTNFSKNNYLLNIQSDIGSLAPSFDPLKQDYTIMLTKYDSKITLSGTLADESARVTGFGTYDLKLGETKNIPITVTAQSGDTRVYNVSVTRPALLPGEHSSKLATLVIEDNTYEMTPEFASETTEYEMNIPYNLISLKVDYTAYDPDAVVSVTGNGYIKAGKNGVITVTVENPYCEKTVYKVNLKREGAITQAEWEFDYTGEYQTFTVPYTGYYQIELWGAAGQYYSSYATGKGAYTSGKIWLTRGTVLYVYVGNRATGENGYRWNGGGQGGSSMNIQGAGGGATDIRITPTSELNIWNEFDSLKSRIMVAAGGGGHDRGGAGGTLVGLDGDWHPVPGSSYRGQGGTQTSTGGQSSNGGGQGGFGYGGTGYLYGDGHRGGGGGGGWYGGSAAKWHAGGGGGSSYISGHFGSIGVTEASTSDNIIHNNTTAETIEDSYSYTGYIFTDTVMIAGNSQMPSKTAGYTDGNTGNGFARITKLPDPSTDNFLASITVKVDDVEKIYNPDFDMLTREYYLTLEVDETKATLFAKPNDSTATINGLGEISILSGTNVYPIEVIAENGDKRIYNMNITRPASSNSKPIDITVNGLVPSLCDNDLNSEFCLLKPAVFNPETKTYYLTVPSRIKQLWFEVEKGHDFQTVTGDGKISLEGGENIITIEVTSEDETSHTTYTYYVTRDMTGNADLDILNILDPTFNLNYDPDIAEYYLTVPNQYDTYQKNDANEIDTTVSNVLQFYAKTDDDQAKVVIDGDGNLNTGMNNIGIIVTAKNGNTKIYVLHVYREKNSNVFLDNLEVLNGTTSYTLKPIFNELYLGTYQVTVPNEVSTVNIKATAQVPSTSRVTGAGVKTLSVGSNKYSITITAEDGSTETYTININREKNGNTNLTGITVSDSETTYPLLPTFNTDILNYTTTVNEGVSTINITATPEVNTTTYRLLDGNSLKVGENIKRVMAVSENGDTKTYTITITRPANSNNYLSNIEIKTGNTTHNYQPTPFDRETLEYTLEVENDVTNVTVTGTKESNLSKLVGNGNYGLKVGENEIKLTVTSETNEQRIYTIKVTRKPNSNAYLKLITTTEGILAPNFDEETKKYTINVEDDINSIRIDALPKVNTTTVTPARYENNNLESGSTEIQFVTLAEDGTTTLTYTVEIIKDKSSNDNASNIIMEEGILSPAFNSNIVSYTVTVPNSVTKGTFHVTAEHRRARVQILNNGPFEVGVPHEVTIRIRSESGQTKDYKINVLRQELETASNYLTSLSIDSNLVTGFDKTKQYYEVTVPYSSSSINVSAIAEDLNAQVDGTGTKTLKVGQNLIGIKVTGTDGKTRDYQILVTREKNSEARLSMLTLANNAFNQPFDKDTYLYTTSTTDTSLTFGRIEPMDANATYQIYDNYFTTLGTHEVIVRVTAEDGITTKDYVISVNKEPSNNNNLASLSVEGYTISPSFNKMTTLYTLTVPNNVNTVIVNATAEDSSATINGTGIQILTVGTNNLVVEVVSQSGNRKAYTISIIKEGNNDATLDNLIVHNGVMKQQFNKDTTTYDVSIPYSETELDLTVITSDENASYIVSGNKDLQLGNNRVLVTVTAENGTTNSYILNVVRENIISALLKNIKVANYEFNETFNSNVFHYTMKVGNETTSLNMNIIPLDKDATYEVTGNKDFIVGNNTVAITVTSSDGLQTEIYIIDVERQEYANNFLDYLYTSEGDVTPTFDKTTMKYSINVSNETTEIELIGAVTDKTSTVTGLGTFQLKTGENIFKIIVTSSNGTPRTYYVTVNRDKSDANYLLSLTVKNGSTKYALAPDFDKNTQNYTVHVPRGLNLVVIDGTISEKASVTGLGTKSLVAGDNEVIINVTSESGLVRPYTINIIREASNNNHLIDLIPSIGSLSPSFTYENTDYTIYLDSAASSLSFSCSKEDLYATITGNESILVPDGTSTRTITVTAENGDKRYYNITVIKERSDNALLSSLSVIGYPFTETFDPQTFEYHITVPNDKATLTAADVIATAQDSNARITKMNSINLSTKNETEYLITVTAPDKFTTQAYKIIVTREKGSVHSLLNIRVNIGKLTSAFVEGTLEYEWKIPKNLTEVTKANVTVTPRDINSIITMPEAVTITGDGDVYVIKVEAEDKTGSTEYKLNIKPDLSAVGTLRDLSVDKGMMSPSFSDGVFTYDVYEYEDCDSITVTATPSSNDASVISGDGLVTLSNDTDIEHKVLIQAEDGTIETYTLNIHKTISRTPGLKNLGLNGLENVECILGRCKLTPNFDTDTTSYNIKVPFEYENLDILAETMNNQQTVKYKINERYIESYNLPIGTTAITIEVYDGFQQLTREYTLRVERCQSNNANLESLEISYLSGEDEIDLTLNPVFNKNTLEYTIEVPASVNEVIINATPEDKQAQVALQGYNYLQNGNNDATIEVFARDGSTKTYIVHIIKSPRFSSYLKSIKVSTGSFWNLEPKFQPTVFEYTVNISSIYDKALVEATPVDSNARVVGEGQYELSTGSNIVTLTVTATDGTTSTYKVNIVKVLSRNVNLSNLIVEEGNLSPIFEKGTTKYTVNVDSNVDKLTIHAVLEDPTSTFIITGNEHLVTGENIVNVIVLSNDKSISKTYQLKVNKKASNNTYLTDLKVIDAFDHTIIYGLKPTFDKLWKQYDVEVNSDIEKVEIIAASESNLATVTGIGEEYLSYGSNTKTVKITAEDGTEDTYTVNIYRNYNLYLSSITIDGTLIENFDPQNPVYTINVGVDTDSITILGTSESDKVTVEGNGTHHLNAGRNEFTIKTVAPDGKNKPYKVVVNRTASDNNYIESLIVHEGRLKPDFIKTTTNYEVSVRKNITSLIMDIELEDKNATYRVLNNSFSGVGDHDVTIEVKAEDKTIRNYVITVHVQEDSEFSNRLTSLSITNGKLTPDFDPDLNYYIATVPNSVNSTVINATKENIDARITGLGKVDLEVGRNVFYVTVTSKDGIDNVYTLVIYRNGTDDATLSSLSVEGQTFTPIFNKTVENYNMAVDGEVNDLVIEAIPTEASAKVEITGDKNLTTGVNVVTIKVTAPDGTTTKTYSINVTKNISTNNYLSSLEVVGNTISPGFVKTNQGPYTVEVENSVNSVLINATKESSKATLTGDGVHQLEIGQNVISISVTSESGSTRIYTVVVNRKANSDSTLKQLVISDGLLKPVFDPGTTEYTVEVSDVLDNITVIGFANAITSTVTGNDKYDLTQYETVIPIVVTAQDNSKTTYNIKVLKGTNPDDQEKSSKLAKLVIKEGELSPSFHKNTTNYTIKVPYEITSLEDIVAIPEDTDATVVITGNKGNLVDGSYTGFTVGNNRVEITVTAEDNSSTTTYVVMVNRQIQANNYLSGLEVVGQTLNPTFNKTTLYYEVEVANSVNEIEIVATKESSTSTVTGDGIKTVEYGENTYIVTVTSSSGSTRTYTIVVNRPKSDENLLLTLTTSIGEFKEPFDPAVNNHTIEVPEKTSSIVLTGTVSENATVIGLGTVNITGDEQTQTITVTSQTGVVNTYNIKIVKASSANTKLTSLTPSAGTLDYSNDETEYEMDVEDNITVISFTAVPEDSAATVTGGDLTTLDYGENTITITVTAEDGTTTRTITIKVNRKKDITSITADPNEIMLGVDEEETITYTVEPTDTDYPDVEFVSSDEEIATVDDTGKVKGIKIGSTTVEIISKQNPAVKTTVTINVISKKIISSVYDISRDTEEEYTIGADPKTKLSKFIDNFDNNPSNLFVYDSDDNLLEDLNKFTGTNMKIKLIIKDVVYDELVIIVRGDINGDGLVTVADQTLVKNIILGSESKSFINKLAADVNKDDKITVADITFVKNYILGSEKTFN